MSYKCLTAYIKEDKLDKVGKGLINQGCTGFSYFPVKGFGELVSEGLREVTSTYRMDIITSTKNVDALKDLIINLASENAIGDGIISISDVEEAFRIRDGKVVDVPSI